MKLSVVIPVYNEVLFIDEILARVIAAKVTGVEKEIIIKGKIIKNLKLGGSPNGN